MKKNISFILLIVFSLFICSCSDSKHYLNHIYEIDNYYENQLIEFNHKNLISIFPSTSFNKNVVSNKQVTINNKNFNINYRETLQYPLNGEILNKYIVDNIEENTVLLNTDGTVNSILFDFAVLDINIDSSKEYIINALENLLEKIIDVSQYEYVEITGDPFKKNSYGIYDILYYNMVDSYITNYARVSVDSNGEVFGLSVNNLSVSNIDININKNQEDNLLSIKLKDIFTTDTTEYQSYTHVLPARVIVHNNELCILYSVSAKYNHSIYGETASEINQIIIPVNLMSSNNSLSE